MSRQFPAELSAALNRLLEGVSRRELAGRSARLSSEYRQSGSAEINDRRDLIAYAVARMPATYAAVSQALRWTMHKLGNWQPSSHLDLGSGPGTAIWAARTHLPWLTTVVAVERHTGMMQLARELDPSGESVTRIAADVTDHRQQLPRSDLVTAAYLLGELDPGTLPELLDRAWAATAGTLVLVEPGTPAGAKTIGLARRWLIAAGGHPVAPCPNGLPCPMVQPSWCHFPARLPRSRDHMHVKGAIVPFEDEKFAYLAVSRIPPTPSNDGRLVGPVAISKPAALLQVCHDGEISELLIPRRESQEFRRIRKLYWGDTV